MRIPTWRVALSGGTIAILVVAGIGLAAAGTAPTRPVVETGLAAASEAPSEAGGRGEGAGAERLGRLGEGARARWLLRAGRHLVHAEVTITGRDGELIDIWLDHGTVQSLGGGNLVIAEATGTTETLAVDEATKVWVARQEGDLDDLTAGAEVFVQSRVEGGVALAKRILVIPDSAD